MGHWNGATCCTGNHNSLFLIQICNHTKKINPKVIGDIVNETKKKLMERE